MPFWRAGHERLRARSEREREELERMRRWQKSIDARLDRLREQAAVIAQRQINSGPGS